MALGPRRGPTSPAIHAIGRTHESNPSVLPSELSSSYMPGTQGHCAPGLLSLSYSRFKRHHCLGISAVGRQPPALRHLDDVFASWDPSHAIRHRSSVSPPWPPLLSVGTHSDVQPFRSRWEMTLKHCSTLADLQRAVRYSSADGPAARGCRSLCWKVSFIPRPSYVAVGLDGIGLANNRAVMNGVK